MIGFAFKSVIVWRIARVGARRPVKRTNPGDR